MVLDKLTDGENNFTFVISLQMISLPDLFADVYFFFLSHQTGFSTLVKSGCFARGRRGGGQLQSSSVQSGKLVLSVEDFLL